MTKRGEVQQLLYEAIKVVIRARQKQHPNDVSFTRAELLAVVRQSHPDFDENKLDRGIRNNVRNLCTYDKPTKTYFAGKHLMQLIFNSHQSLPQEKNQAQLPDDSIDLLTLGKSVSVYLQHMQTRLNHAESELRNLKQDTEADSKKFVNTLKENSALKNKIKTMKIENQGKVSAAKYKELLDENRRLKDRLDEQNKRIQQQNMAGKSSFKMGELARFRS